HEGENYFVTPPYFRRDIQETADLVEEIGRVYGYDKVEASMPAIVKEPEVQKSFYYTNIIKDILIEQGFSEVYTYAFQPEGEIELKNKLAQDKGFLRADLSLGLSQALDNNLKYRELIGLDLVKLFEIGKIFTSRGERLVLGLAVASSIKKIKPSEVIAEAVGAIDDRLSTNLICDSG